MQTASQLAGLVRSTDYLHQQVSHVGWNGDRGILAQISDARERIDLGSLCCSVLEAATILGGDSLDFRREPKVTDWVASASAVEDL